jgi:hypothetical protein
MVVRCESLPHFGATGSGHSHAKRGHLVNSFFLFFTIDAVFSAALESLSYPAVSSNGAVVDSQYPSFLARKMLSFVDTLFLFWPAIYSLSSRMSTRKYIIFGSCFLSTMRYCYWSNRDELHS